MSDRKSAPTKDPPDRTYHGGGVFSKLQKVWRKGPDGRRQPVLEKARDGSYAQKQQRAFYVRFQLQSGQCKVEAAGTSLRQAREKLTKVKGLVRAGLYVDERAQAQKARAERKAQQEREAKRLTFSGLVDRFLKEYRPRGGDRSSHYRSHMKALRRYLGDLFVDEIGVKDVDRFVAQRRAEKWRDGTPRVNDSTLRKDLTGLSTLFRWAVSRGLAASNPASPELVRRPPEPPGRHRWLLEEEYGELIGHCPQWLADIVTWACYSGMDQGQVLALRWTELTLEKGPEGRIVAGRLALARGKTGKVSRFVFSTPLLEILNTRKGDRSFTGLVFHEGDGRQISRCRVNWVLRCALKAAKVTGVSFKTFRHTAATWALRRGIPVKVVSDMLGQSVARTTEIYLHTADDQLEAAARAMSGPERLVTGGTGTQTAT